MNWKEEFRNALLDMTQNPPDVRKIVKPHIPKKLFKYGSFQSEYWKQTIYKAEIFLSPAKVFNDPFDCRANFNYEKAIAVGKFRDELIRQFGESGTKKLSEDMVEKVIEGMREDVFVFCFSEIWNSLLMWAHYANNYNGYCIEYDMGQVRDYLTHNLYPVLYEKDYIDITNNLININRNTGLICNLTKAEEWSYEKEWRIVEYRDHPFFFRKALKAIYLGMNCVKEDRDGVIKWAKTNNKKVYMIKISKLKYELEAERIV